MRALVPTGRPGHLVEIGEVDLPRPAADEALVRITRFSLNRPDFLYLSAPGTGYRPGIDAVGVVERAAADGSGPATGSRVALHLPGGGAAAQFAAVPARRLVSVPDAVSSDLAAALPLGGLVARRLLAEAAPLAGRTVLATGMGGGVGQFAVQLAVAEGARITVVASEDEPWQHLPALGAEVVHDIDSLDNGTFDVVLESVGGRLGSAALRKLAPGGLFLWFGQASSQPLTLDFFALFDGGRQLTLHHFVYLAADDHQDARDLAALLELAAQGRLRAEIGHLDHWSRSAELLEEMAHGRLRGKAVLTLG
ncbi:zinc-binding dehydrogenase [Kitasatospora sp. NPDC058406]|uniref:zinc-binding dehydrogenase n=1 Tax=Kitasatospora sp. NPDC058406 TaxID=3346483 RepID=UPI003648419E